MSVMSERLENNWLKVPVEKFPFCILYCAGKLSANSSVLYVRLLSILVSVYSSIIVRKATIDLSVCVQ